MQEPLQISYREVTGSQAIEDAIRERADKLDELSDRITSCRVVVASEGKHRSQGRAIAVSVDLRIPDHEIVVTREHHEDAYVAVREAFDDAGRQLQALVKRERDAAKHRA